MSEKEPRIIEDIDELINNLKSLPDDVTEIWAQPPDVEPPHDPDAIHSKPQLSPEESSHDEDNQQTNTTIYSYHDFLRETNRSSTLPLARSLGARIRHTAGEIFHAPSHLKQTHGD